MIVICRVPTPLPLLFQQLPPTRNIFQKCHLSFEEVIPHCLDYFNLESASEASCAFLPSESEDFLRLECIVVVLCLRIY